MSLPIVVPHSFGLRSMQLMGAACGHFGRPFRSRSLRASGTMPNGGIVDGCRCGTGTSRCRDTQQSRPSVRGSGLLVIQVSTVLRSGRRA